MEVEKPTAELKPVETDGYRELRLLSEVSRDPEVTQRSLSRRVGIALGLTNLLLRSLARKGYVRITRATWRRWVYTLTPAGFSRKARLTGAYIQGVLQHYQWVRQILRDELEPLGLNEESVVALYVTDDFGELVYLALRDLGVEQVDVLAPEGFPRDTLLGAPVRRVSALQPGHYDRVVAASLQDVEGARATLLAAGVAAGELITLFPHAAVDDAPAQEAT